MNPDWKAIERDVMFKLRLLRAAWESTAKNQPEVHEMMARDIYLPALECLAEFSGCVEVGEPEPEEQERVN